MDNTQNQVQKESKKGFTGCQVTAIAGGAVVLTVIATLVLVWFFLYPRPFKPVVLTPVEQQQLDAKLDRLESSVEETPLSNDGREPEQDLDDQGRLIPRPYTEEGESRGVSFTEREVNALIATNTDLADKFAVDLSDNLVSARMLVPVDPDFPFFGGKTLRVRAGLEVAYRSGKPVVKLRGVSIMGVPMPNAWLGGMKNIDLVEEFSADKGFWKAFSDGVESIEVGDGEIHVMLKE